MKAPIIVLLLTLVSVSFQTSEDLDFRDCGSVFHVNSLRIEDCTDTLCRLFIGQSKTASFELVTVHETNVLVNEVYLYWRGMKWPLMVSPTPCDIVHCPVKKDYSTTYYATIYVDESYLQMDAELYWIMTGDNNSQLVCFSTSVVILF